MPAFVSPAPEPPKEPEIKKPREPNFFERFFAENVIAKI